MMQLLCIARGFSGGALVLINKVTVGLVQLVLGWWLSSDGQTTDVCNQPRGPT